MKKNIVVLITLLSYMPILVAGKDHSQITPHIPSGGSSSGTSNTASHDLDNLDIESHGSLSLAEQRNNLVVLPQNNTRRSCKKCAKCVGGVVCFSAVAAFVIYLDHVMFGGPGGDYDY